MGAGDRPGIARIDPEYSPEKFRTWGEIERERDQAFARLKHKRKEGVGSEGFSKRSSHES